MIDKIALALAIIGCIYLGIAGLLNLELANFDLNNPYCLLKRFFFSMVGVCGIWCFSFFFKFKNRKIELN